MDEVKHAVTLTQGLLHIFCDPNRPVNLLSSHFSYNHYFLTSISYIAGSTSLVPIEHTDVTTVHITIPDHPEVVR